MSQLTVDSHIKEILKEIAAGDKRAFQLFFKRYYNRLVNFALLFVKDHANAEDVVSEVLIKLLRNKHKLSRIDRFEGYLFLAVKNQSVNFIQKNYRQYLLYSLEKVDDFQIIELVDPEVKYLEDELRCLIVSALQNLPPQRQIVYRLIKEEGLKYKEVAEILQISINTVENHFVLAIKSLRNTIGDYLDGRIFHIGGKKSLNRLKRKIK